MHFKLLIRPEIHDAREGLQRLCVPLEEGLEGGGGEEGGGVLGWGGEFCIWGWEGLRMSGGSGFG